MRKTFSNVDTTPTPECKKAKKAFTNFCTGDLAAHKADFCAAQDKWKKAYLVANPNSNDKKVDAARIKELKSFKDQKEIIKDKASTPKQKKDAQAVVQAMSQELKDLGQKTKITEQKKKNLKKLVEEITKNAGCVKPACSAGEDPDAWVCPPTK
jgi:hypothetical protein